MAQENPTEGGARTAAGQTPRTGGTGRRVAGEDAPQTAQEDGGRDRGKPRMSEGVRADLQAQGYAIDPGTGELLVADGADTDGKPQNVRVIPREDAAEELRKRAEANAKRDESATPRNEPAL